MYSRVYLEITNVCNKNCSFCAKTKRKKQFMSLESFDRVTDSLVGVTKYLYLHLMGEPLLHKDIGEMIRLATQKGFKCAITTNATLIGEVGDTLIDAGVYKVNMSLHSFQENDSEAHRNYVLACTEFAKKATEKDVLCVFRLWNGGSEFNMNDHTLKILKECFPWDWVHSQRGARIKNKLHLEFAKEFVWPDMSSPVISDRMFCYGLSDHFGILCDGQVVPCCLDHEGDMALGNIFENSINEILEGDIAKAIRQGFEKRLAVCELCKRCGYATRFSEKNGI